MAYHEVTLKTTVVVEASSAQAAKDLAFKKIMADEVTIKRFMATREVRKPCLGGF
jgi:hypothetical protein